MSKTSDSSILLRTAVPEDGPACGQICYDAFAAISLAHGFASDFPSPEVTTSLLSRLFSAPDHYCLVAESEGRIVGSNCLDHRSAIAGVGPVAIEPSAQNRGIGRKLMHAVMDHAHERGVAGVRLVQVAYHARSLSLYAGLGFDVREPLACMQGRALQRSVPGCNVRPAQPVDVDACNSLSRRVHGFDRATELAQAIQQGTASVVERAGRITGYTTGLSFFGHAAAETNLDMQSLIVSAESFAGPGILVPMRNSILFRWCLQNQLRVVQPLTLMTIGLYNHPAGAWLPSVLF